MIAATFALPFTVSELVCYEKYCAGSAWYNGDDIRGGGVKWHVACMGEIRNAYKILVGQPGRKELVKPRSRWKDTGGCEQGPVADCCEHGSEASCYVKVRKFLD
jgi:hypothetical protein